MRSQPRVSVLSGIVIRFNQQLAQRITDYDITRSIQLFEFEAITEIPAQVPQTVQSVVRHRSA